MALLALCSGAVAVAFAPIFVRLSSVGPSATAFWRLTLALPALWLWMTLEGQGRNTFRRPLSPADYLRLSAAGLFFAGDLAVWHWSIRFTSVANATLLANFAPIFVALGGWLFFAQRVGLTFLLGMSTALIGTTLMVGTSLRVDVQHLWGDTLGLITALFYAGYILSVKRLRGDFSAATIMAWSGAVTSAALFPVAFFSGEHLLPSSSLGWRPLIGLAFISQVGGQGLIAYALAHLPAAFSSLTLLLEPVMATIFAWLILNETIGPWQALGGVLVLGGIFAARRVS
ncbi:MAG TPA: DMT family transporter [Candidatus Binatia bacterium]|jgi:drug/metabolite transporter (DMT)-like permease|nr:DMT family transporter [Candidatus Binatia bacterium]